MTLADEMVSLGHDCTFVCRAIQGSLAEHMSLDLGLDVVVLPENTGLDEDSATCSRLAAQRGSDWVVVDHYGLDARWETEMRSEGGRVLVIDDLADRPHECHVLLDQNLQVQTGRYDGLVPSGAELLLGPTFALLRSQFRSSLRRLRAGPVRRVLVSFGGSDPRGLTTRALDWLAVLDIEAEVVAGPANVQSDVIAARCERQGWGFHGAVDDMATMMAGVDLAIGAPGSTTWERCFLGLPSIVVAVADNQEPIGQAADEAGIALYLGREESVADSSAATACLDLTEEGARRHEMSQACLDLVDGKGRQRVARAMLESSAGSS